MFLKLDCFGSEICIESIKIGFKAIHHLQSRENLRLLLPPLILRLKTGCRLDEIGHWLDMVYLPPRGNFVDHIFLEAQCLASILHHVSPLTMVALSFNSL